CLLEREDQLLRESRGPRRALRWRDAKGVEHPILLRREQGTGNSGQTPRRRKTHLVADLRVFHVPWKYPDG
ncbi:MAG: hypothetical protein SVX43_15545, partial [Cyanobacteriota bacterium]|nr:hypothetical protein [Cyanobacteriota bacterium]